MRITISSLAVLLLLITCPCYTFAQTGTSGGTYDFSALGRDNSAGPGLKRQRDKFKVSNIFVQDGTGMYANNVNAGASQQVSIQAEGGVVNKNFTFLNLNLRNYAGNASLDVFTITLRNYFGALIATHQLAGAQPLSTAGVDLSDFNFTVPFPAGGYPGVADIEIEFHYADPSVSPDERTFSSITAINISGFILPLTLVNFEVSKEKSGVRVNWLTAEERSIEKLVLEHSVNGRDFQPIADFRSAGLPAASKAYTYFHSTAARGSNYYRLKEVGLNGDEKTFIIKSIDLGRSGISIIGANPLNGALSVRGLSAGIYNARLIDMSGKPVYTTTFSNNGSGDYRLVLPATIQSGTYLFIIDGQGEHVSVKLVKQ